MKTTYMQPAQASAPPFSYREFMMLFQTETDMKGTLVDEMLSKAKQAYVMKRHTHTISTMNSDGKRNGWYKTYVPTDNGRKQLTAKTEEALYQKLYDHYMCLEEGPATFQKVFDMLMDRKEHELGRSPETIYDDSRYFSYLSEELRNKPIVEITESDIRTWLVKDYMPTKPKESALQKMLQKIRETFSYGMSKELCFTNPALYIKLDDYIKDCDHTKKADEDRAFSDEEIHKLRTDALTHSDDPCALMLLMASETGMRAGELAALLTSDITEDGFIHVHRQQIRGRKDGHQCFYDVTYTKDERKHPHGGRYVPITPECENVIRLARQLPGESDHLFHNKQGNAIQKDSYEQNLFRRCRRLGITTTNNHAFRVAFNSRMINLDISAADRAMILGHAVETNERNYSVSDKRRRHGLKAKLS